MVGEGQEWGRGRGGEWGKGGSYRSKELEGRRIVY